MKLRLVSFASLLLGLVAAVVLDVAGAAGVTYQYDDAGRLKKANYDDGAAVEYNLDAAGNRTTVATTSAASPAGNLQFSTTPYSGGEPVGQRVVTVSVTRANGSSGEVRVNYATSDGTATTATGDYSVASGQLIWPNGDMAAKTFNVTILDDPIVEGSESLNLALSSPTGGASLGSQSTASVAITDDDLPPTGTLQFTSSGYPVGENAGSVPIFVSRINGSYGPANVTYATVTGGSAAAGTDYTPITSTLSWIDGETATKSFGVLILDDLIYDGPKTVNLSLSNVSGASLGSQVNSVINISDNEIAQPGTLSLSPATYSLLEAATAVPVSVTRSGGTDGGVDVNFAATAGSATVGSDFTATSGSLHWNHGEGGSKTFNVTIVDDPTQEPSETVNLTLSGPTGGASLGTSIGTITIDDNDTVSTPTNVYSLPEGIVYDDAGMFSVNWTASTGPISYYQVRENFGTIFQVTAPSTFRSFSHPSPAGSQWDYEVRGCSASNQCSSWTSNITVYVCPSWGCP